MESISSYDICLCERKNAKLSTSSLETLVIHREKKIWLPETRFPAVQVILKNALFYRASRQEYMKNTTRLSPKMITEIMKTGLLS